MIEATGDFTRQFDMRHLVFANRYMARVVDKDVGRLQQRVTEEAIGRQVLVRQLFLLVLIGGHTFEPAERGHHRQQQMQFGVLQHLRLLEDDRFFRIETGGQPIDNHVTTGLGDALWRIVIGGQGMPVGDKKQTFVIVLQTDPVFEHAVKVTQMQATRRAHAGKYAFCRHQENSDKKYGGNQGSRSLN